MRVNVLVVGLFVVLGWMIYMVISETISNQHKREYCMSKGGIPITNRSVVEGCVKPEFMIELK